MPSRIPRRPTKNAEPQAVPTPTAAYRNGSASIALHAGCQTNPDRKVAPPRKVAVWNSFDIEIPGITRDLRKKYTLWPSQTADASPRPVVTK
jgi:hypothetical protein